MRRVVPLVLLLFIAFFEVLISTSDLSASGKPIEVIETDEAIDFPENMHLSITAQGGSKIVDVRIFYRTAGSSVWAYAYPNFVPAFKVTASLNLTQETSNYLPPGTEVEYYYEIADAQGNVLQTDSNVVMYEDTRFEWEHVQVGPLTLSYYDQPESHVRSIIKELESDLEHLGRILLLKNPDDIKGVIYSRRSHTLEAFPQKSRTTTEQKIFQGFAFPDQRLFLGLGMDRGLIVHETSHLLLSQAMGKSAHNIPSWLDEGFASYMDHSAKVISGASMDSHTKPLRSMNKVTGTPHSIGSFYQKSLSVVSYMINDFGESTFQQFLGKLRDGSTMDAALVDVYGFDVDGLEARWATEPSGARHSTPSEPGEFNQNPSPFLYFNSWLLGGLILLVLFTVSIQYIVSKLRAPDDSEKGLQPWGDPYSWDDNDSEEPLQR